MKNTPEWWAMAEPWWNAVELLHRRCRGKVNRDFYFDWLWDISWPPSVPR